MSLRMTVTTEFGPEVQVMAFMRMRKKKWWKTAVNGFQSSKFSTVIRSRVAESNVVVKIKQITEPIITAFQQIKEYTPKLLISSKL